MNWKPITPEAPQDGETVELYNGVRAWVGKFRPALLSPVVKFPPTHYAPLELPYPPIAEDRTDIDRDRVVRHASRGGR